MAMSPHEFEDGKLIIVQGDVVDSMYVCAVQGPRYCREGPIGPP
jgi:hypothetical protein